MTDIKIAISKQPALLTCVKDNGFDLNIDTWIRYATACIITLLPKPNVPIIKSPGVQQLSKMHRS